MDLDKIPVGRNPPWELNVVIEVPLGGEPVKYEMDKDQPEVVMSITWLSGPRYLIS